MEITKCTSWLWTILILLGLKVVVETASWAREQSISNGLSIAGRITTVDNVNLGQCIVECYADQSCITVGVAKTKNACQLYNLDLQDHKHLTAQTSTSFYKSVCDNQAYTYIRSLNTCIKRTSTPMTHSAARTKCQSDGGDLLMVKSNDVRLYLKNIMLSVTDTYQYWLGGKQSPGISTNWTWADGTVMTSDNGWSFWAAGEPSNATEECLQIQEILGEVFFLDKDCDEMAGFLCEMSP